MRQACPPRFATVEEANAWLDSHAEGAQRTALILRRVHGCLTVAWALMIPVSILTGLKNSLPYLVALSVYALAVGHFASWQGSRAEVANDSS